MLLHCDFVVAGTDAGFSTPFVSLGLVPEAASSLLAPLLMGQRRAFEFLVMGHPLNATHAKDFGIANMVVAPQDVDAEALKAAREIAALPPGAVALSRGLMRGATDEFWRASIRKPRSSANACIHRKQRRRSKRFLHANGDLMSLKGKTLFITGASRGIGLAIALRA